MACLGIYFGAKAITIVESQGRKVINNMQIPQPGLYAAESLEDKVPLEAKMVEIVALFKSELRRNKVEVNEATLCLSGRDLIIRTFPMPNLPHDEMQGAVNFETKKYIPFKSEELISDFQLQPDRASRGNIVLFVGIKKETLDRYVSIFDQLNIRLNAIEYSAFSILRIFKLAGLGHSGIAGIFVADLKAEEDANFIVVENGFPLFSRDIVLMGGPGEFMTPEETGKEAFLEKLKKEIRVSVDYYKRMFPAKNIQKIFFSCNETCRGELEAFLSEAGFTGHFLDTTRVLGKDTPDALSFAKAYSASLSRAIKTGIRVNVLLRRPKLRPTEEKKGIQENVMSLLQGFRVNYAVIAVALLLCIATFAFSSYRIQPLKKELNEIIKRRQALATANPQAPYEELDSVNEEYKQKLQAIESLVKKQFYVTGPLNVIPRILPEGIWLNDFSFSAEGNKLNLSLQGAAYLGDSNKEFGAVDKFLSGLKESPEFSNYFSNIEIISLRSGIFGKVEATNFSISCRNYEGKD